MNGHRRKDPDTTYHLLIGLAAPLLIIVMWLVMLYFYLQSPVVNLGDVEAAIEDLSSPPDLPLVDLPDDQAP
jgi:uncharacterized metal-binding protein